MAVAPTSDLNFEAQNSNDNLLAGAQDAESQDDINADDLLQAIGGSDAAEAKVDREASANPDNSQPHEEFLDFLPPNLKKVRLLFGSP